MLRTSLIGQLIHEGGTGLSGGSVCISGAPSSGSANRHLAWTRAARLDEGTYIRGLQVVDISADVTKGTVRS